MSVATPPASARNTNPAAIARMSSHDHAPQPQRVARRQREIAAGDSAQTGSDRGRQATPTSASTAAVQSAARGEISPAATGRERLCGWQAILLTITHVVDQIGRAGDQAQHDERPRDLRRHLRAINHARGAGSRQHEQVLAPLARTARPQQYPCRGPSRRPQLDRRLCGNAQLGCVERGLRLLDAWYRLK